jgi:hypothetical protein
MGKKGTFIVPIGCCERCVRVAVSCVGCAPGKILDWSMPSVELYIADTQKIAIQEPDPQFEEYYFGDPSAWTFDNLWPFNPLDLPDVQV